MNLPHNRLPRVALLAAFVGAAFFVLRGAATSPSSSPAPLRERRPAPIVCRLVADPTNEFTSVPRPRLLYGLASAQAATINVTYVNFTAQQQAAFQSAVDIWRTQVASSVPIEIYATMEPLLPTNILGQAGATWVYRNFSNAAFAGTWYQVALANKIAELDLAPGAVGPTGYQDIDASFNSNYSNWSYRTDGLPVAGQYDFMTVVLHELGHGLGFAGSMTSDGTYGSWGFSGSPEVYDRFTENGAAQALLNFATPSTLLQAQLTGQGGGLFWNGSSALSANNGIRPTLYAPNPFQPGSSYSHLDDATYPAGNPNSLMTHALGMAEVIHDPGPIVRGVFQDEGWGGQACTFTLSSPGATFGIAGGTGSVNVTASSAACLWSATSNVSWVTITAGSSGTGNAVVSYAVTDNVSSQSRTATLTIAGQSFTVTQAGVPASPTVVTQPTSQTVASGGTATFTAAASGNPAPTVQWQVSTNAGSTWADIIGATSTTYSFTVALADNGTQFRAVFTNIVGSVTSAAATLTVTVATAPAVTTPPTNQTVASGGTATFTAAASGNPAPAMQWQVSTNAGTTWTDISGATSTTDAFTVAVADNGKQYRAVFTNTAGSVVSTAASLTVYGPASLSPAVLRFGATKAGAAGDLVSVTPAQAVTVIFSGSPASWTTTADQPWVQITNGAGTGPGRFTVGIINPNNVLGASVNVTSTITVTASNLGLTTTLPITLAVQLTTTSSAPPFGYVDTPVSGATGVTGSIGVTGWALDDVGVSNVKIYRNCLSIDNPQSCQTVSGANVVFIGDAAFLAGARPDVQAAYPAYPFAYRAGWGYLMLTNMLPHVTAPTNPAGGGQGPLTIYAYATDMEANRVLLGQKTITLDNDHAVRPFGAIDTPSQGGTWSGVQPNFGWALTPGTALIPTDGSTMHVVVDGVAVGTVTYNQCRAGSTNVPPVGTCRDDVATLFPAYTNITGGSGAIGSFLINTSTLSNGLHTIAWGVVDNQNRNDGIGSRFFTVLNGSALTAGERAATLSALSDAPAEVLGQAAEIAWRSTSPSEVYGRTGFDFDAPLEPIAPDSAGERHVTLPELGRLELSLGDGVTNGYLQANGTLRPLPPGSQLDPSTGIFTWAPGPGYIGTYDLVFLQGEAQVALSVTIQPKTAVATARMRGYVDLPAAHAAVSGTFTVAGWALDLNAWQGSGVGAVHVWAWRRDVPAAAPAFLGAAEVGGVRPDVAAAFGAQFDRAGWGLTASSLDPGIYDVTAYFWSTRTGQFEDARTVSVTVR